MAAKTGLAFNPEQMKELSSAMKALANNTQSTLDEVKKVFDTLRGDEVLGDGEQKEVIVESINSTEQTFVFLVEKLNRMILTVDSVCEKLGISTSQNIRTTEEAVNAINAQSKKVKEATGANA